MQLDPSETRASALLLGQFGHTSDAHAFARHNVEMDGQNPRSTQAYFNNLRVRLLGAGRAARRSLMESNFPSFASTEDADDNINRAKPSLPGSVSLERAHNDVHGSLGYPMPNVCAPPPPLSSH